MSKLIKRILIAVGIFVLLGSAGVGSAYYYLNSSDMPYVIDFINTNPDKVSFVIQENGEEVISRSAEKPMPLASVFKIMVVIELARQVDEGRVDLNEEVPIEALNKYVLVDRENDNHDIWVESMDEDLTLEDIARGMITHSSNPNTDYLIDRLGLENINRTIKKMTKNHSEIYPIGPSELMYHYLTIKNDNAGKDEITHLIEKLSYEDYKSEVVDIDTLMKEGSYYPIDDYAPSYDEQKTLIQFIPTSTANEYIQLLSQFNSDEWSKQKEILFQLLSKSASDTPFDYVGGKNGETLNIINEAVFARDKEGNSKEIIFFAKDLTLSERMKLEKNIDEFIQKLLNDELELEYRPGSVING